MPVSLAKNFPLELNLKPDPPAPAAVTAEQENVLPASAGVQFGANAPLPVPRPAELASRESRSPLAASGGRLAQQDRRTAPPTTPAENRTFFDKLFGRPQPSGSTLAYAAPEDGVLGNCAKSYSQRVAPLRSMDRRLRRRGAYRLLAQWNEIRSAFGPRREVRRSTSRQRTHAWGHAAECL